MATRLFDYIHKQADTNPLEKSFCKKENDKWKCYSTHDIISQAKSLATGLMKLGLAKGDKVAIVAYVNRPEWYIADLATQYLGIVNVPLYPTISTKEYEYILNQAEVKACFVGKDDLWDKVSQAKVNTPSLQHIFTFDKVVGRPYFEELMDTTSIDAVDKIASTIASDDLATIIYTSGTTGNPKGVMLTHGNIISVVDTTLESFPIRPGSRVLSFLPFCHIFERACIYGYSDACVSVYCTGTDNLGGESGDLANVKPNFFTTVPRLLEKVYEKIINKGLALTGIKKWLFFWALDLTDDYQHFKKYTGMASIKRKIADKLIYSKWRQALGGSLEGIVTGAAPCPAKIARVFSAAGIPIMEGYGLTETSPTISINRFDGAALIGTVGTLVSCTDVLIDDADSNYGPGEGEILASGPNIMQGYYKNPEETAAVLTNKGGKTWFKTGDIGKFIEGPLGKSYLQITDRKKELLKTSGGKYVAPAPIESRLKEEILIEQAIIVGDGQKFVSTILLPNIEGLSKWCQTNNVDFSDPKQALKDPKVKAAYQACIDRINPEFSHVEQIKKFEVVYDTWDAVKTDGSPSELTPTMKLKRRVILSKYEDIINSMYA